MIYTASGSTHLLRYILHADAIVAFIVSAFTILDDEYLRALVVYMKVGRDLVRQASVFDEIKIVESSAFGCLFAVQPALGHAADGAAGAVLEDNHRLLFALLCYLRQLLFFGKRYPIHDANLRKQVQMIC